MDTVMDTVMVMAIMMKTDLERHHKDANRFVQHDELTANY